MTTQRDCGAGDQPSMLHCPRSQSSLYPTLVLALRDMRQANGRNPETGTGEGNESWIGLCLAMIVLDTLSGSSNGVTARWKRLLTSHEIPADDADIIYALRCSLLHGYGIPQPSKVHGRKLYLTPYQDAFAVDTSADGRVLISVPVFCGRLVERVAAEAPGDWDTSTIDTDAHYS
jgi:hypothetical protein